MPLSSIVPVFNKPVLCINKSAMEVAIIQKSNILSERLAELIYDSYENVVIHFIWSCEHAQIYLKKNQYPDLVLLDEKIYEEHPNETLTSLTKLKKSDTCVMVLYNNVISSLTADILREHGVDYFIDLYPEFENIPGIVQEYCQKKKAKNHRPVLHPLSNENQISTKRPSVQNK